MRKIIEILSEGGRRDAGQVTVRVLALVLTLITLAIGLAYAQGSGIYVCLGGATLLLLTAALPLTMGRFTGSLLLLMAFVVALAGLDGEVGMSAYGALRATPFFLVGAVFTRPDIVTMLASLFARRV